MNVLTFLAKNWDSVLVIVAFLAVVVVLIKRGETKILKQILFNLVTQAEKQFGSGTGSLKYAAVADWIYQRIPAVLKLLFTSSDIEKMIEAALEEAKKAWGANENLKGYIDTPSVESLLVGIEAQTVQTEPAEN
nr:MAG TPA: holin [Caudoviricetes sp.]